MSDLRYLSSYVSEHERLEIVELMLEVDRAPQQTQKRIRARFRVLLEAERLDVPRLLTEVRRTLDELRRG